MSHPRSRHPMHHHQSGARLTREEWMDEETRRAENLAMQIEEERDNAPPGFLGSPRARRGNVVRALEAATNYVRVSGLTSINGGSTTSGTVMQWQWNGRIIGISLSALKATSQDTFIAAMSNLGLRISVDGSNEELFINGGNTQDFGIFSQLCGALGERVHLFRRPIRINRNWTVYVQNFAAATAYTPEIGFHIIKDEIQG